MTVPLDFSFKIFWFDWGDENQNQESGETEKENLKKHYNFQAKDTASVEPRHKGGQVWTQNPVQVGPGQGPRVDTVWTNLLWTQNSLKLNSWHFICPSRGKKLFFLLLEERTSTNKMSENSADQSSIAKWCYGCDCCSCLHLVLDYGIANVVPRAFLCSCSAHSLRMASRANKLRSGKREREIKIIVITVNKSHEKT